MLAERLAPAGDLGWMPNLLRVGVSFFFFSCGGAPDVGFPFREITYEGFLIENGKKRKNLLLEWFQREHASDDADIHAEQHASKASLHQSSVNFRFSDLPTIRALRGWGRIGHTAQAR